MPRQKPNHASFEKALLIAFKEFFEIKEGVKIDFRKQIYLANPYGNYPTYSWEEANSIINAHYCFLDKHSVNYSGRLNKEMDFESLKTQKLKGFLIERLTQEISPVTFYGS